MSEQPTKWPPIRPTNPPARLPRRRMSIQELQRVENGETVVLVEEWRRKERRE